MTPLEEVEALLSSASSDSQRRTVVSRAYYVSFRTLVAITAPRGFNRSAQDTGPGPHRGVHRRLFDSLKVSSVPILRRVGQDLVQSLFTLRIKADYRFDLPLTTIEAEEAVHMAQTIEDWLADAGLRTTP